MLKETVEGFEPLTIFTKRSMLDIWQGFEYASAANAYFSIGKKLLMQLQELLRLFKGRSIMFSSYCLE